MMTLEAEDFRVEMEDFSSDPTGATMIALATPNLPPFNRPSLHQPRKTLEEEATKVALARADPIATASWGR